MARVALAAWLLGVGLLLGACAGKTIEDGGDAPAAGSGGKPGMKPTGASAAAQCKTLATTWCNKAFGCYVQVGRLTESSRQPNVDHCIQLFVDKAPCSEVMRVGANYDKCVAQINAMACSKWDVPTAQFGNIVEPTVCETALSFD